MKKALAMLSLFIYSSATYYTTFSMHIESSSSSMDDYSCQTKTLLQEIEKNSIYKNQKLKYNQEEAEQFNKIVTQTIYGATKPNYNIFGSTKPTVLLHGINNDLFKCDNKDHLTFLSYTLNECVLEQSNYDLVAILSKIHEKYMDKITLPQETNDLISKQLEVIQQTGTQSFNATIFPALKMYIDDIQQRSARTLSMVNNFLQEEDQKLAAALYFAHLPHNHQYTQPDINNHEKFALQLIRNKLADILPVLQTLSEFISLTIKEQ